jgi:hypothetical protein
MKDFLHWAVLGFFGAIIAAIIFVKAGKGTGQSGGQQSAAIINATGSSLGQVASSLEGG